MSSDGHEGPVHYEYLVYHKEDAKVSLDRSLHPFEVQNEASEYGLFPTTLALRLTNPNIIASSRPAEGRRGVIVSLISTLPEECIRHAMDDLLRKQNADISGLCLVSSRIS